MAKRLMVVDDSIFVYEEMKFLLHDSEEFEIVEYAKSGEEALEKVVAAKPDVVTMDIILPGMDGIDAAAEILKILPGTRIVVVSSLAYDDTIERARNIGARDFLFKPIEKEQLFEALRKATQVEVTEETRL